MKPDMPADTPGRRRLPPKTPWQEWLDGLSHGARMEQEFLAAVGAKPVEPSWFVVYITDVRQPELKKFATLKEVQAFLQAVDCKEDPYVLVFFGQRATITQGPWRYLRLADGAQLPLFAIDPHPEDEPDGYMGETPPDVSPGRPVDMVAGLEFGAAAASAPTDDFDEEAEEEEEEEEEEDVDEEN